jgi:dolichol kinase
MQYYRLFPEYLPHGGGRPPILISLVTAFIITIFELVPLKITSKIVINDNLAVPVIAGFAIALLNKLAM